jgi:hypothetical protein
MLPIPLTLCFTSGSPRYSTLPAPERLAFSDFAALTTTRPAPATEIFALSLSSRAPR